MKFLSALLIAFGLTLLIPTLVRASKSVSISLNNFNEASASDKSKSEIGTSSETQTKIRNESTTEFQAQIESNTKSNTLNAEESSSQIQSQTETESQVHSESENKSEVYKKFDITIKSLVKQNQEFSMENAKMLLEYSYVVNCAQHPLQSCKKCFSPTEKSKLFFYFQTFRMTKYEYKMMIHHIDDKEEVIISFSGPKATQWDYVNRIYREGFATIHKRKAKIEKEFRFVYYRKFKNLLLDKIQKLKKSGRQNFKYTFTGFSVGGPIAILAGLDLTLDKVLSVKKNFVSVYTYGGLRIGDESFNELVNRTINVYKIVNYDDYVVKVPHCYYNAKSNSWSCLSTSVIKKFIKTKGFVLKNYFFHYAKKEMTAAISKNDGRKGKRGNTRLVTKVPHNKGKHVKGKLGKNNPKNKRLFSNRKKKLANPTYRKNGKNKAQVVKSIISKGGNNSNMKKKVPKTNKVSKVKSSNKIDQAKKANKVNKTRNLKKDKEANKQPKSEKNKAKIQQNTINKANKLIKKNLANKKEVKQRISDYKKNMAKTSNSQKKNQLSLNKISNTSPSQTIDTKLQMLKGMLKTQAFMLKNIKSSINRLKQIKSKIVPGKKGKLLPAKSNTKSNTSRNNNNIKNMNKGKTSNITPRRNTKPSHKNSVKNSDLTDKSKRNNVGNKAKSSKKTSEAKSNNIDNTTKKDQITQRLNKNKKLSSRSKSTSTKSNQVSKIPKKRSESQADKTKAKIKPNKSQASQTPASKGKQSVNKIGKQTKTNHKKQSQLPKLRKSNKKIYSKKANELVQQKKSLAGILKNWSKNSPVANKNALSRLLKKVDKNINPSNSTVGNLFLNYKKYIIQSQPSGTIYFIARNRPIPCKFNNINKVPACERRFIIPPSNSFSTTSHNNYLGKDFSKCSI